MSDELHTVTRGRSNELELALSSAMIAAGGLLLGVQLDGLRRVHGTGYAGFAMGLFVALLATALVSRRATLPRDAISWWGALVSLFGVAVLVGGVLVPSGPWLFVELALLTWFFARARSAPGLFVTPQAVLALAAMLYFRLWLTYQASLGEFQVGMLEVPVLSKLPFEFLTPFTHIPIGSFTADELAIPATEGLDFAATIAIWALGFTQVVVGLTWRARAAREHEDDRIHATIRRLPAEVARLVEGLIPESEWESLELHGLAHRKLEKRIEQLVRERVGRAHDVEQRLRTLARGELGNTPGFGADIAGALESGKEKT
ncbi:MAG: hypothetical protein HZA52_19300 [Planctomycetes bacterium]|nr:hypothetical protein [Planctomycetota bacterium]